MRFDWITKILLLAIAVILGMLVFRPIAQPEPVFAQSGSAYPFQILEGVVTLRKSDGTQTWGKVAVDMRSGDVWGFPMPAQSTPYPVYGASEIPKVSHPMYLGKMALSEAIH
jgi:hypothetical protein